MDYVGVRRRPLICKERVLEYIWEKMYRKRMMLV